MANAWKRNQSTKIVSLKNLILFVSTSLLLLAFLYLSTQTPNKNPHNNKYNSIIVDSSRPIKPFDCYDSPQAHPVFANTVEGLKFPFLYSLSDYGNLPDKPHKNIVRTLKGKPFRRPDISATVQELLEKMRGEDRNRIFVDVGANVGMATFAAAVMGFKVLAFEPVFENLQRICEGIYFNRVGELVQVFEAAASDTAGNITFHKLVGRLDNSAVYEVNGIKYVERFSRWKMGFDDEVDDMSALRMMKDLDQGLTLTFTMGGSIKEHVGSRMRLIMIELSNRHIIDMNKNLYQLTGDGSLRVLTPGEREHLKYHPKARY